ncbi:pyruvate kinase [Acrasis kona]|uniref:Pyruvate kinase n=1 Tax=Acrasis kona TaxID=1008807 RepID=A0AAW2YUJ7_9EUKA
MSSNTSFWLKFEGSDFTTKFTLPQGEFKRRTKIVATIGPKTQTVEALCRLFDAGVNVVRLNFSHGSHEFHKTTIVNARIAAEKRKVVVGIMLDTKGPEIRSGELVDHADVHVEAGQKYTLTTQQCVGDNEKLYVDYANITKVIKAGQRVLIDDGLVSLLVDEVTETDLHCTVENSGAIGEKKGINLPGVVVDLPAVTEKDKQDLEFGVKMGVDFIAASFVRKPQDVEDVRTALGSRGQNIKIISKIENAEGLENFDAILKVTDGIMVARGDMGVEIPIEQVCIAQKMIIAKCNTIGKPVITATQMLESMIVNPRPTRAEATDVANAVFDGTDSVMLSGETAKGKFPFEAVETMSRICVIAELCLDQRKSYSNIRNAVLEHTGDMSISETIASSAVKTANDVKAGMLFTITETGNTARLVAKYRPQPPVLAITQNKETARQLMISRGVHPLVVGSVIGAESIIKRAIETQKEKGNLKPGEYVIVTSGHIEGIAGQTNILKCITA